MAAAEAEGHQHSPEAPQTTESSEAPEMPDGEEDVEVEEISEEESAPEEPNIYEFAEDSGYAAGDLEPAYEELGEDDYQLDEEAEKVLIGKSTWKEVEGLLSEDEEDSSASWSDRIKSYLFNHDKEYAAGGAAGIGTGLFTGFLGYTTAASLMLTGGGAALGWGVGSYLGEKISNYISNDEPCEESEEEEEPEEGNKHELREYSDWDVEIVNEESYGQAVEEYIQETQE